MVEYLVEYRVKYRLNIDYKGPLPLFLVPLYIDIRERNEEQGRVFERGLETFSPQPYLTYYLTPNNGRISNIF